MVPAREDADGDADNDVVCADLFGHNESVVLRCFELVQPKHWFS